MTNWHFILKMRKPICHRFLLHYTATMKHKHKLNAVLCFVINHWVVIVSLLFDIFHLIMIFSPDDDFICDIVEKRVIIMLGMLL